MVREEDLFQPLKITLKDAGRAPVLLASGGLI